MLNKIDEEKIPREYRGKIGREIRAHLINGSSARVGVFEYFDEKNIYLKPCLIDEGLYNEKREPISIARIETETSLPIRRDIIGPIEPLSEGYMERLCNSINRSLNRIILP